MENNTTIYNKPHEPERHVVLFSGGFDSPYVLFKLMTAKEDAINNSTSNSIGYGVPQGVIMLDTERIYANDTIAVLTVINNMCGTNAQRAKEKKARENIMQYMEERFPDIDIERISLKVSISTKPSSEEIHAHGRGLYQPIVWTFSMIPLLHTNDHVYFSYIKNDQSPIFLNEISRMITDCGIIMGMKKPISVHFPIKLMSKSELLVDLYGIAGDIFESAVSCEGWDKDIKFCGNCSSCNHLKAALFEIVSTGTTGAKMMAKEYLNKYFPKDFANLVEDFGKIWFQQLPYNAQKRYSKIFNDSTMKGDECNEEEGNQKDTSQSSKVYSKERRDDIASGGDIRTD